MNRRTVLRGIGGVSLGLPWMETMLWGAEKGALDKSPLRLGVIYQPNGINPYEWTPGRYRCQLYPVENAATARSDP